MQENETYDVVVVGSGAAGAMAALRAADHGLTAIIIEKAHKFGGTSATSGGVMWIPANRFMDPGEDSVEKGIEYLNNVVTDGPDAPGTSPERRRACFRRSRILRACPSRVSPCSLRQLCEPPPDPSMPR